MNWSTRPEFGAFEKITNALPMITFDDVQIIPRLSTVPSRKLIETKTRFTRTFNIDIPLVAAPMDTVCGSDLAIALMKLGGVGILHRFNSISEAVAEAQMVATMTMHTQSTKYPVASSIGATGDYQERAVALLDAGANVLLIDVAHGHHSNVANAIEWLKGHLYPRYEFDIIAGNVATEEATIYLEDAGADAIRVGVGGGSVCETRIRTGVGVPQLTSVLLAVSAVKNVPVISDGGIRYPGDVAKALAAGADSVMIGSLFAGTEESPGEILIGGKWPNNQRMKIYRGSASATIKMEKTSELNNVEGATKVIPMKGTLASVVHDIMDGVQSSMSYVGATNLGDFYNYSQFVKITSSGLTEAHPHLL